MFVRIKGLEYSNWGIGKVEDIEGGLARISFFDSPVKDPIVVEVPTSNLRRLTLPRQTRVYWQNNKDASWRVGRVLDEDGEAAEVRFPNMENKVLKSRELYVRWDRPIADPTAYLAQQVNETPLFAETRSGFTEALTRQRAACQGMSALISSVIDLEPHQIDVIRRVLQDPVQRYLLADEVGLGKTIEAAVLIRQHTLDDPTDHRIIILVPPALICQWRDELVRRFLLEARLDNTIRIVSTTESPNELSSLVEQASMLVIDEAHHLSRNSVLYSTLRQSIIGVPRLLLLSATPVLRNERGFLEMLHLLDPYVYPLDQEESFRQRIEHRQKLAEIVAGLVPENLFQLDLFLDELTEQFEQDHQLQQYVEKLRPIVEKIPEETDSEYRLALYELRTHLSEIYRLDRRILRNRRRGVPGLTPTRDGAIFIDYQSDSVHRLVLSIEQWRSHVAAEIYGREHTTEGRLGAKVFADILSASLSNPAGLAKIVRDLLDVYEETGFGSGNTEALESDLLREILFAAEDLESEFCRYEALADYLVKKTPGTEKYVIFCSEPEIADRLSKFLEGWNLGPIDRHVDGIIDESNVMTWTKFLDDQTHRILVCDAHSEEGLNLQGRDKVIVHFDMPLAPNRIEQRIGRVDRYGTGGTIISVILRCVDDQFEVAWDTCLDQGFGVFHRSIASLQYLVEDVLQGLSRDLLIEGLGTLDSLTERLGGSDGLVEKELRRIDDQDALDTLATPPEESIDDLIDVESDWRGLSRIVDKWLVDTLMMTKVNERNVTNLPPGDAVFRLRIQYGGHGPNTLIPLSTFLGKFRSTIDIDAPRASPKNLLTYPYTYRRETALTWHSRRTQHVRLLRLGEPFLEGLNDITALDDRGRSAAMWRHMPGYETDGAADIYIKFNFVVEADVDAAVNVYAITGSNIASAARAALSRRGDTVFPPFFQSLWLNGSLEIVDDGKLQELLSRPYNKDEPEKGYLDRNLTTKRWRNLIELGLPVMDYWKEWVSRAKQAAEALLYRHAEIKKRTHEAVNQAKALDASRFAQLRTRIERTEGVEAEIQRRYLELEKAVAGALYRGIIEPHITLDAVIAVFLSGKPLPETSAAGDDSKEY